MAYAAKTTIAARKSWAGIQRRRRCYVADAG
jgi:hypothetical protein